MSTAFIIRNSIWGRYGVFRPEVVLWKQKPESKEINPPPQKKNPNGFVASRTMMNKLGSVGEEGRKGQKIGSHP